MNFLDILIRFANFVSSVFLKRNRDSGIKKENLTILTILQNLYKDWGGGVDDVSILGVRNESSPDQWNDFLFVKIGDKIQKYRGTVDPGKYYTNKPMDPRGCAHLCLGFYKNLWQLGNHRGYAALVQVGKCKIWRDKNKNFINDDKIEEVKNSAINFHHGNNGAIVGANSAGCQVVQSKPAFENIIKTLKSMGFMGKVSYLLIPVQNCPKDLLALKEWIWYNTSEKLC